jgi:hypothetical protein
MERCEGLAGFVIPDVSLFLLARTPVKQAMPTVILLLGCMVLYFSFYGYFLWHNDPLGIVLKNPCHQL